jgi:hypothetical protein
MVPKTICHIPINFTMISSASFQKLPNGDEKNYKYKEDPLFFTQFTAVIQLFNSYFQCSTDYSDHHILLRVHFIIFVQVFSSNKKF